jgi:hypothetical protein
VSEILDFELPAGALLWTGCDVPPGHASHARANPPWALSGEWCECLRWYEGAEMAGSIQLAVALWEVETGLPREGAARRGQFMRTR